MPSSGSVATEEAIVGSKDRGKSDKDKKMKPKKNLKEKRAAKKAKKGK